ncbi:hypothetical protein BX600DRAFT_507388 [Xylariales sp. PMI_506]|nr:hypothetical protein BX600DRAFT_507388 [Xylariales sp. PMI_506]
MEYDAPTKSVSKQSALSLRIVGVDVDEQEVPDQDSFLDIFSNPTFGITIGHSDIRQAQTRTRLLSPPALSNVSSPSEASTSDLETQGDYANDSETGEERDVSYRAYHQPLPILHAMSLADESDSDSQEKNDYDAPHQFGLRLGPRPLRGIRLSHPRPMVVGNGVGTGGCVGVSEVSSNMDIIYSGDRGGSGGSGGGQKRKRRDGSNLDQSEDEFSSLTARISRPKRPKRAAPTVLISCPFRVRDPRIFNVRDHQACSLRYYKSMAEVRQHISRHHRRQAVESCQTGLPAESSSLEDGVDQHTLDKIYFERPRVTASIYSQWYDLWSILFPDVEIGSYEYTPVIEHFELVNIYKTMMPELSATLRNSGLSSKQVCSLVLTVHRHFNHALELCKQVYHATSYSSSAKSTPGAPIIERISEGSSNTSSSVSHDSTYGTMYDGSCASRAQSEIPNQTHIDKSNHSLYSSQVIGIPPPVHSCTSDSNSWYSYSTTAAEFTSILDPGEVEILTLNAIGSMTDEYIQIPDAGQIKNSPTKPETRTKKRLYPDSYQTGSCRLGRITEEHVESPSPANDDSCSRPKACQQEVPPSSYDEIWEKAESFVSAHDGSSKSDVDLEDDESSSTVSDLSEAARSEKLEILRTALHVVFGTDLDDQNLDLERCLNAVVAFIQSLYSIIYVPFRSPSSQGTPHSSTQASSETQGGNRRDGDGTYRGEKRPLDAVREERGEMGDGPRLKLQKKEENEERPNLRISCPFRLMFPGTFKPRSHDHWSCSMTFFTSISKVRQHIRECHEATGWMCQRCRKTFATPLLLQTHVNAVQLEVCQPSTAPHKEIDSEVSRVLGKRSAILNRPIEDEWSELWGILFPGTTPKPYHYLVVMDHYEVQEMFLSGLPELFRELSLPQHGIVGRYFQDIIAKLERRGAEEPYRNRQNGGRKAASLRMMETLHELKAGPSTLPSPASMAPRTPDTLASESKSRARSRSRSILSQPIAPILPRAVPAAPASGAHEESRLEAARDSTINCPSTDAQPTGFASNHLRGGVQVSNVSNRSSMIRPIEQHTSRNGFRIQDFQGYPALAMGGSMSMQSSTIAPARADPEHGMTDPLSLDLGILSPPDMYESMLNIQTGYGATDEYAFRLDASGFPIAGETDQIIPDRGLLFGNTDMPFFRDGEGLDMLDYRSPGEILEDS